MHTVFPMGIMVSSNCMRTHTCYDRGRGACCVTVPPVKHIPMLPTFGSE